MIDKTNIYLFYNVYGDAEDLIKLAPDNVIFVPFGWDEETEANRNAIIEELGVTPSCLPSIVAWKKEEVMPPIITQEGIEVAGIIKEARWEELRVGKFPKYLWNWMHIMSLLGEWE